MNKFSDKELLKLKKKVDNAQLEEQQLKGQRKAILVNLKEDFDCDTIEQATQERKQLEKKAKKFADKLEEKLKEIEKEYNIPDEELT